MLEGRHGAPRLLLLLGFRVLHHPDEGRHGQYEVPGCGEHGVVDPWIQPVCKNGKDSIPEKSGLWSLDAADDDENSPRCC